MTDIDLLGHSRLNIWQDVIPHQGLSLKLTWIKHLLDVYLEFEIVEIACDVVSVSDGKLTFALFSQVVHLHLKKKYNNMGESHYYRCKNVCFKKVVL